MRFNEKVGGRGSIYSISGGARVLTQGGHDNLLGGAIYIDGSGASEPAKFASSRAQTERI